MTQYRICASEIVDGKVEIPDGAIVISVGLTITKPLSDPGAKLKDAVKFLLPIEEKPDAFIRV